MAKQLIFTILVLFLTSTLFAQTYPDPSISLGRKVKVLLVGSSHWNNFEGKGLDIAQTSEVDILSTQYQEELKEIAQAIVDFNPKKVFIERTLEYQPKLDSLYQLYLKDKSWGDKTRNEIYQLGFRVAGMLKHDRVYGIDYLTSFPYNKMKAAMKEAGQTDLIAYGKKDTELFEAAYNKLVHTKAPLKEFFRFLNSPEMRKADIDWYLSFANQAGKMDDHTGSLLASNWIKRNIYAYGLIQKYLEENDDKIMILMGSSHIAVFDFLMQTNPNMEAVELIDILDNK